MKLSAALVILLLYTPAFFGFLDPEISFFPAMSALPQAESAAEIDAYGFIAESRVPKATITLGDKFLQSYPNSAFRSLVFLYQMHAYQALDNYEGLIEAGEEVLRLSKENIDALVTLADALASKAPPVGPQREEMLKKAENYATLARQQLRNAKRDAQVPRPQFGEYKRRVFALNAATFGLIALERRDLEKAIEEYETAVSQNPDPRGVDYLRLGIAFDLNHQPDQALRALRQAASLGPQIVTKLAEKEINLVKATRTKNK